MRAPPPTHTLTAPAAATSDATETVAAARTHRYDGSLRTRSLPMFFTPAPLVVPLGAVVALFAVGAILDYVRNRRAPHLQIPDAAASLGASTLATVSADRHYCGRHQRRR